MVGNVFLVPAVVAYQGMPVLMVREAHCTVLTFRNPPTVLTAHHRRIAPPVLEDDHLLFPG